LGYLTKNYKTDVLINFATLTGSVIQTLGYQVAGLFSNNDTLASNLYDAGQKSNENVGDYLFGIIMPMI
jgi:leucyl aminopeptidase